LNPIYPLPYFLRGFYRFLFSQNKSLYPIFFQPDFFQDSPGVSHSPPGPRTAHQVSAGPFRASEKGHSIGPALQGLGQLKHLQLSGTRERYPAEFLRPFPIQSFEDLTDFLSLLSTIENRYVNHCFHVAGFNLKNLLAENNGRGRSPSLQAGLLTFWGQRE
jgi:hypothetical protein